MRVTAPIPNVLPWHANVEHMWILWAIVSPYQWWQSKKNKILCSYEKAENAEKAKLNCNNAIISCFGVFSWPFSVNSLTICCLCLTTSVLLSLVYFVSNSCALFVFCFGCTFPLLLPLPCFILIVTHMHERRQIFGLSQLFFSHTSDRAPLLTWSVCIEASRCTNRNRQCYFVYI